MKKIIVLSLSLLLGAGLFAQNLEALDALMKKGNYAEAKAGIDKITADPKNADKANVWYYKATVYNNYSNDSTLAAAVAFDLKTEALEAYKKTQLLDKLDVYLKMDSYRPYLYVYSGFYNLGANQFNKKDFEGAYKSFNKALEVKDFILSKKYEYADQKLNIIDTALLMNAGAAAINAKNEAGAVGAYKKLADANVTGPDYENVYLYLSGYYNGKKDDANLQTVLAKGKANYPKNNYWNEIEMDKLTNGGDKGAMFAKYEELYVKNPSNFANDYNYAVELYNSIYGKDAKNTDPAAKEKLTAVLKSAMAVDTSKDATMLLTNHLFNYAADYSTSAAAIKSIKPEDIKKKKALTALANAKMDEVIPFAEVMVKHYQEKPPVKSSQKINYKNSLDYLSDIYNVKNNPKKAAEYDKIREGIKF